MWLPVDLPIDLKESGIPVESSEGGLARSAGAARAIVEALRHSTVAIVGCEIFRSDRMGLVPLYTGWSVERHTGESASDFAARSRAVATTRIDLSERSGEGERFYALVFTGQQDAA